MLRRNILIFHSGALGDFVLSWPLAVALGRIFAQSRIVYVTAGSKGELAKQVLGVEAVDSENGWHGLYAEDGEVSEAARKWLEGASLVFSFVARAGDVWCGNVERLSAGAKVICVRPRSEESYPGHVTQFVMEQLGELPMVREGMGQIVSSLGQRGIKLFKCDAKRVVIHPGAGAVGKCWGAEKYLEVIERLQKKGEAVRVVLGEVERERWSAEQIARFESVAEVVWPGTYIDLLVELRESSAFVGNDSGPGHLGGMIGVPTIAIFQEGNEQQWRPLGPRVRVMDGSVRAAEVVEAIGEIKSERDEPRMDTNEHE